MKRTNQNQGFTIVEMLTVMGIIAILIGLLLPALNQVKDYTRQIQQKAQFHSIEVALEMFKNDFEAYPESNDNDDPYDNTRDVLASTCGTGALAAATAYSGANKIAEALLGLDYLGVHPNTAFRADGMSCVVNKANVQTPYVIYHLNTDITNWETADENLKARKGSYIDLENANAFRMDEVYGTGLGVFAASTYTEPTEGTAYFPLVLCDVFSKKRTGGTGSKKTGMPILYYRARTAYTQQSYDWYVNPATKTGAADTTNGIKDDIYYYPDNQNLLDLGTPEDPTIDHPLYANGGGVVDRQAFESIILNKQVTTIKRPYRAGTYILMSAGKDGLYGTGDDVLNFDKGAEQ